MARTDTLGNFLTDIAEAIRTKKGIADPIQASNFDNEILNLSSEFEGNSFEINTRSGTNSRFLLDIILNQNVESYAFSTSTTYPYIGNITGEKNCTTIGEGAFSSQTLGIVNLPYVTTIGTNAFSDSKITELYLPNYNGAWGSNACLRCTSLTKIEMGYVSNLNLRNCTALKTLICNSNSMSTLSAVNSLGGTLIESGTGYIYVPDNLIDDYKTETNWSTYANQIKPLSELGGTE